VGNPRACYEPVPGRCSTLERGGPETEPWSCGTQSAHENLFNRRLRVLSPAVRTNDRHSPRRRSKKLRAAPESEHESRLLKNLAALANEA
jgi:hypothetical protein